METRDKINYGVIFSIVATLVGWGITFGVCENKINTNERSIEKMEQRHNADYSFIIQKQNASDVYIQSINNQLVELNTKVTLLLDNKIKTENGK